MMGIVLDRPFPLFPHGFPDDVIERFSRAAGRAVLGNKAASGTRIIECPDAMTISCGGVAVNGRPVGRGLPGLAGRERGAAPVARGSG